MTTAQSRIIYTPPSEGSWKIPDVLYRGERCTYELFERMTPSLNQDKLSELYNKEKNAGNPHPTDMPLLWAIATQAYELREEEGSERLRAFLRDGIRKWPNTLTRIAYTSEGEDRVIHNYKTSDEYSLAENIVGSDGFISEIPDSSVLETILGAKDVQKINAVSQYLNGTPTYLWRVNAKPKQKDERVARFYADGDWLDLYCVRRVDIEDAAFRVLRVE
ncbi:MAG: hypothetical protein RL557_296 [archaeon]